nr:DUF1080 domain-containing protein [Pseudopedobacter sp.]
MKTVFICTIICAVSLGCNSQQKSLKGYDDLLNSGTANFHTYGKSMVGAAWTVDEGTLHFNPNITDASQRGDLATNENYGNFHLMYDWKIAANGNSGVMFHVNDDFSKYAQPYFTGPEMQVLDNMGHPDAKIIKHRAGDLYDLISCSKETVKPAGEWNHAEIISDNGKLDFILNGETVVSTTMWTDGWNKMVAASKFKDMPDFGKERTGKIVFQDHGNEVWFKNIMIKKL